MKQFIVLILLTMVLGTAAQAQMPDCRSVHDGTFLHVDKGVIMGTIKRKGKKQIETYGKEKMYCSVEWLDACSYQLTITKMSKKMAASAQPGTVGRKLKVAITEVDADGYFLQVDLKDEAGNPMPPLHFVRAK